MEENKENECFICFEVSNKYEKNPSRLSNKIDYFKKCECDGWIHDDCLEKWYLLKETCPICRNKVIYINYDFHYIVHIIDFFLYIRNFTTRFLIKLKFYLKIFIWCMLTKYMYDIITSADRFDKNTLENNYYIEENKYYNDTELQIL